jgi:hypothetical protein
MCNVEKETPLTLKLLSKRCNGNDQQAQELLEALLDVLWHTDSNDKRFITVEAEKRVGQKDPNSLLVLLLWPNDEDEESWADLARLANVNRSTVTRHWLPKAIGLFIDAFLDVLQEHLCERSRASEYERIRRLLA